MEWLARKLYPRAPRIARRRQLRMMGATLLFALVAAVGFAVLLVIVYYSKGPKLGL